MSRTAKTITLDDARTLGYAEYGDPSGFPIVYCHGSQSSRLEMHYDTEFATAHGLRIITIDRPGHGLSDINPNGSILSFAEDVEQLLDRLDITGFSVAGMSAGCPFALGIAYHLPERVRRVSIIAGFAPYSADSRKHLTKSVAAMLEVARSAPPVLRLMLKAQERQLAKNPEKALAGFLKIMSEPDQQVLKDPAVTATIQDMFTEAFRHGSAGVRYETSHILVRAWGFDLGKIDVPVVFWNGDADNNVPVQWARLMADALPDARVHVYPGEGHLVIFGHAEEIFTSLVDEVG